MGYNRAGTRRTKRLRRAKRECARLAAKPAASHDKPVGLTEKVKDLARGVADAVGGAVKSAVEAVTGKGS
jgi:phage-related minor tail protein